MNYRPKFDIGDQVLVSTRSHSLTGELCEVWAINIWKTRRNEVAVTYTVETLLSRERGIVDEQDLEEIDE